MAKPIFTDKNHAGRVYELTLEKTTVSRSDRATRTISPFSKITVPEYIENRIKEKTHQSLDEAEQLVVGNAELLQRISEARTTLEQTK